MDRSGHTPVYGLLNEPVGTENLWISDQKMGVDGGAVYGGVLHGLLLDDQGIVHDYVLHNTGFFCCRRLRKQEWISFTAKPCVF